MVPKKMAGGEVKMEYWQLQTLHSKKKQRNEQLMEEGHGLRGRFLVHFEYDSTCIC